MLDVLFKFPIVMVDGDNEEKRMKLGIDEGMDIIYGYAECPYYNFISIVDRWSPNEGSLDNAINGKFDACGVLFAESGTFIVPWTREKFKKEFKKFVDNLPEEVTEKDLNV